MTNRKTEKKREKIITILEGELNELNELIK